MEPALRPFLDKALGRMSEEEFRERLAKRREELGALLDDAALALLVLDEAGANEGAVVRLADARGRSEATVRVRIDRHFEVREFARENGERGRVANALVHDASGEARLTLWGKDVRRIEDGDLAVGRNVKVVNARVKDTRWGLELHVGPWSVLEVEGAIDPARRKLLTDTMPGSDPTAADLPGAAAPPGTPPQPEPSEPAPSAPAPTGLRGTLADFGLEVTGGARGPAPKRGAAERGPVGIARAKAGDFGLAVEGRLVAVAPTRTFRRADGTTGFVADALVEDATGSATLVAWDEAVKAVRSLSPGHRFRATELSARERGGRVELHTTARSAIAPASGSPAGEPASQA